jgi:hypothetical protein
MYIDCIDMTDSNLGNNRIQWLNYLCVASTQLQFYGMSNGVQQMVNGVTNAASGSTIDVLRIWGHGGPGGQNVTAGASGTSGNQDFAGITVDNFNQLGLEQLASRFSSGGSLELRGCNVAADGSGNALLLDLASLLCVPVYGGILVQDSGLWTPPVTCAYPSGGLATTAGPPVNGNASPAGN